MKILYIKWKSFGSEDIETAFRMLGHEIVTMPYSSDDVYHDEKLEEMIVKLIIESRVNVVFSSNYYVPVAIACNENKTPYISWIYDNPFVRMYSYTAAFETNYIFVFDRELYEEFNRGGIKSVFYMPLAAAPERLMSYVNDKVVSDRVMLCGLRPKADIAFVGSLYDEEHTFFRRMHSISDYSRGYLEGLMAAQSKVFGFNFVRSMMNESLMDDMSEDLPMDAGKDSIATREYLFAEYVINREITARERYEYLAAIGERFGNNEKPAVDLYTRNPYLDIRGVLDHGPIDHINLAPFVYNHAKINLNITLRSIHTGIPLRAFEILGSGGFLLSNYQADFADCYVDGEDYVSFGSKEDMLNKIEYYLSHERERKEIAANGLRRTMENHTYEHRLREMLTLCNYP